MYLVCFIDRTKAYDFVDRTLLWTVLARFGVPQSMISVIYQFHHGMRACVRLDDRVCSRWFAVEQSLRQRCALAPFLFNIFSAANMTVAYTRFKADKDITDTLVNLKKKKGAGRRGGGGKQLSESQSWRSCLGACLTLTVPRSSRIPPSS